MGNGRNLRLSSGRSKSKRSRIKGKVAVLGVGSSLVKKIFFRRKGRNIVLSVGVKLRKVGDDGLTVSGVEFVGVGTRVRGETVLVKNFQSLRDGWDFQGKTKGGIAVKGHGVVRKWGVEGLLGSSNRLKGKFIFLEKLSGKRLGIRRVEKFDLSGLVFFIMVKFALSRVSRGERS